ncbi:MAG: response regulator [Planctomycetota bacterium]
MAPGSQSFTVLLADDDNRCRDSLGHLLAGEGFQILSANGGSEALQYLRPTRPAARRADILILDYNMPDLDGLEVLRVVRQELRLRIPTILVSGNASAQLETSVLQIGGFALVPKPIEPISFRQLVWRLVETEFPGNC